MLFFYFYNLCTMSGKKYILFKFLILNYIEVVRLLGLYVKFYLDYKKRYIIYIFGGILEFEFKI